MKSIGSICQGKHFYRFAMDVIGYGMKHYPHYPFYLIDNDLKKFNVQILFHCDMFYYWCAAMKPGQAKGLWAENQKVELTAHTEGSK